MEKKKKSFDGLFLRIIKFLGADIEKIASNSDQFWLPRFSSSDIIAICQEAEIIFSSEPSMMVLETPITIVGDLHGHFLDLLRILHSAGLPPLTNYLFLGDLVDRGEFSLETVVLVLLLKIKFPSNVYIIRGNHEFDTLCNKGGFLAEIESIYPNTDVYKYFISMFGHIPLTALISQKILCVHGGIGPSLFSLRQLREITRPIMSFGESVIDSILWSDPSESIDYFEPSSRGSGSFYGKMAISEFLSLNSLSLMIRGHECVINGSQWNFDNKLLTVFSASNYCGLIGNDATILNIGKNLSLNLISFPPLEYLKRSQVSFVPSSLSVALNSNKIKATPSTTDKIPKLPNSTKKDACPSLVKPGLPRSITSIKVNPKNNRNTDISNSHYHSMKSSSSMVIDRSKLCD